MIKKKVWFRADGGGIMTIILCSPLAYTDLVAEPKWQTAQAARDNRVCESADAPESFKTDVWKHFAVKKWEKLTGRRKTVCRRCRTKTNTSRRHFFFFFSTNCNVQSLIINKCTMDVLSYSFWYRYILYISCCIAQKAVVQPNSQITVDFPWSSLLGGIK